MKNLAILGLLASLLVSGCTAEEPAGPTTSNNATTSTSTATSPSCLPSSVGEAIDFTEHPVAEEVPGGPRLAVNETAANWTLSIFGGQEGQTARLTQVGPGGIHHGKDDPGVVWIHDQLTRVDSSGPKRINPRLDVAPELPGGEYHFKVCLELRDGGPVPVTTGWQLLEGNFTVA